MMSSPLVCALVSYPASRLMRDTVDAHTAHHLYYECLKGDLMRGRTVILVSHHVQLCAPGASYVVALENGRLQFQGSSADFQASEVLNSLVQSGAADESDKKEETEVHDIEEIALEVSAHAGSGDSSETASTSAPTAVEETKPEMKKAPRKLIEEEKRAVGRIGKEIWMTYIKACGGRGFWAIFLLSLFVTAACPVLENGWLK